ncbi:MAG: hypothetical protein COA78_10555 [Blastopirellula sp.]|nr:MAG: hypothetical protein COA78_10555 [Blastopirellula sp.]
MPDENPYRSPEDTTALQEVAEKTSPPSKVVLVVAVVNFLLGTLGLICSGVSIYVLVVSLTADASWVRAGPVEADSSDSIFWVIALFFIVVNCLLTGVFLLGGIGVLFRKKWGRTLTLLLAVFICSMGIVLIFLCILGMLMDEPIEILPLVLLGLGMQIYPVLVFSTLTREKYAAEFAKTRPEATEDDA